MNAARLLVRLDAGQRARDVLVHILHWRKFYSVALRLHGNDAQEQIPPLHGKYRFKPQLCAHLPTLL